MRQRNGSNGGCVRLNAHYTHGPFSSAEDRPHDLLELVRLGYEHGCHVTGVADDFLGHPDYNVETLGLPSEVIVRNYNKIVKGISPRALLEHMRLIVDASMGSFANTCVPLAVLVALAAHDSWYGLALAKCLEEVLKRDQIDRWSEEKWRSWLAEHLVPILRADIEVHAPGLLVKFQCDVESLIMARENGNFSQLGSVLFHLFYVMSGYPAIVYSIVDDTTITKVPDEFSETGFKTVVTKGSPTIAAEFYGDDSSRVRPPQVFLILDGHAHVVSAGVKMFVLRGLGGQGQLIAIPEQLYEKACEMVRAQVF